MDTAKPVPSPNTLSSFATQQGRKNDEHAEANLESSDNEGEDDHSNASESGSESSRHGQSNEPQFDFQKFLDQMKLRSAEPVSKYLKSCVHPSINERRLNHSQVFE